ncbi:hypothetical protein R1sor_008199 [Riccia sorocarpa]|uniref:Transposase n=1 Tax=Riccia sorocarpa TaxID=122646 RepID=A0ABD3HSQ7_9MARC
MVPTEISILTKPGSKTTFLRIHSQCNRCAEVRRSRKERNRGDGLPEQPFDRAIEAKGQAANFQNLEGVEVLAVRCSSDTLSHTLEDVFKTAEAEDVPVFACFDIAMCEGWAADMGQWPTCEGLLAYKTWLKTILQSELDLGSGTYWEMRRFSQSKRSSEEFCAVLWCSYREDRTAGREYPESELPRQAEKRRKITQNACKGCARVTVNVSTSLCSLEVVHMERHAKPHWRENKIPAAAIDYMEAKAEIGIRRHEVYRLLTEEGLTPAIITRAQVNYWVDEIESWSYGKNEIDQQLGASKFKKKVNINEVEVSQGGLTTICISVLTRWLESLRGKGLKPAFFITDKDVGQIKAAQMALPRTYVQLCLKHSLDVVKKRIESAEDSSTHPYNSVEAKRRFDFIDETWRPGSAGRVLGKEDFFSCSVFFAHLDPWLGYECESDPRPGDLDRSGVGTSHDVGNEDEECPIPTEPMLTGITLQSMLQSTFNDALTILQHEHHNVGFLRCFEADHQSWRKKVQVLQPMAGWGRVIADGFESHSDTCKCVSGICKNGRDGTGTWSSGWTNTWTNMEAASSAGLEREYDFSGGHATLANKDHLAAGSRNARDNWENDFPDGRPTYTELRLTQTVAT